MAKDLYIWTKIMTYHRAMSHLVESISITLLFWTLYFMWDEVRDNLHLAFFIAIYFESAESMKGILLLWAIVKNNRRGILIYSIINIITVIARSGTIMFFLCIGIVPYSYLPLSIFWVATGLVFISYEWILVYFVLKYRTSIQSSEYQDNENYIIRYKIQQDQTE